MNFTEEQLEAIHAKAPRVCVSAGAGSGKTSVLVGRLIDEIVNRGVGVHEILAITFTNKAADEVKRRVAEALRERGLFRPLRELENAYVSTIDSFCARVLKENPIESGVDPKFAVIEENDVEITIDQILKDVIQALYTEDPDVRKFLLHYQADRVEKSVREIYGKVRSHGVVIESAFQSHAFDRNEIMRALENAIEGILFFGTGALRKKREGLFNAVEEAQAVLKGLGNKTGFSWQDIEALRAMLEDARIKKPRARGEDSLREAVERYQDERDRFISMLIEEKGKPDLMLLKRITTAFSDRYESWKQQRTVLDFPDLLLKAYRLLSNEQYGIDFRYRGKFKLILLDEFQDTSPLQNQLLQCLMGGNSIFLVGDEKQAIYGFRNADVELFRNRKAEFSEADPKSGSLRLQANYRSTKKLISFVNDLFTELWAEDADGGEFIPLVPAGDLHNVFLKTDEPAIEWIVSGNVSVRDHDDEDDDGDDEEMSLEAGRFREAKLLARRLKELVEKDKAEIYDKSRNVTRPVKYGDVAVLFRARTALPIFERALREEELPYFVVGGNGFYQQPEIRDVLSFLSILENPTFDIPLAAVLRSPFVGCADESLLWLSRYVRKYENKETPLFAAVQVYDQIDKLNDAERYKIGSFMTLYDSLRIAKDHLSMADLIRKMLRESRFDSKILGERSGKRKTANVMKLMDIAWKFEAREAHSLSDFVRYLRDLEVREVEEEEAQIDSESDNVIKLITIHKAKGLEFPIVVVADLGSKRSYREGTFVTVGRDGNVSSKVYNPIAGKLEKPISFQKINTENRLRETDEWKRLFYVALTRARERIIFSGVTKNKPLDAEKSYRELPRWMDWLQRVFGLSDGINVEGMRNVQFKEHSIRLIHATEQEKPFSAKSSYFADMSSVRESLSMGKSLDLGKVFPRLDQNEIHTALEQAERIIKQTELVDRPFFETVDVSVTSLLTYETCPRLFYYRHVLKLPDLYAKPNDASKPEDLDEVSRESISPRDVGTFVHRLLEYLPFDRRFEDNLKRRLDGLRAGTDPLLLEAATVILKKFFSSNVFQELASARRVIKEFPFSLRLRHGIVRGSIDLIYETAGGDIVVADYKTGDVTARGIEKEAEVYRTQILMYALAAKQLMRKAPRETRLLFLNQNGAEAFSIAMDEQCLQDIQTKAEAIVQQMAVLAFFPKGDKLCDHCLTPDFCRRHSELKSCGVEPKTTGAGRVF